MPIQGSYGVLHSGWKGTGILAVALGALTEEFGTEGGRGLRDPRPPPLAPAAMPCPRRGPEAFAAEFGSASIVEGEEGVRLDLRAANLGLARSLGLGAVLSL